MSAACARAAIAVGVGVAEGQPIDQILVEAAAAQIPGGAIVVAGYLAAKTLMSGKSRPIAWDTIALGALQGIAERGRRRRSRPKPQRPSRARRSLARTSRTASPPRSRPRLPRRGHPGEHPRGQGASLCHGRRARGDQEVAAGEQSGDALFAYGISQVPAAQQQNVQKSLTTAIGLVHASNLQSAKSQAAPGLAVKLQAVGAADKTPVVAAARAALGGRGVAGFDIGHGLMSYKGDRYQTTNLRAALGADDQKGFDVALALKIGAVASKLPKGIRPGVAAGMLIGKGAQTAAAAHKAAIHGAVAGHPAVAAGVNAIHTQVTGFEIAALLALAGGAALLVAGLASR